jgi:hypothetical protein
MLLHVSIINCNHTFEETLTVTSYKDVAEYKEITRDSVASWD